MPTEDEIRALKRELVGTSTTAERRSLILAQLALRGDTTHAAGAAETRAPKPRAKKAAAADAAADE